MTDAGLAGEGWCAGYLDLIVAQTPGWRLQHAAGLGDGLERLTDCSLPV